jgi:hypothetical protein
MFRAITVRCGLYWENNVKKSWGVHKQVPEIANPHICGLKYFADLPQMWHLGDLRFAEPIFFVICGGVICGFAIFELTNIRNMRI